MAEVHRAEINPELLVWARRNSRMDTSYAAQKLSIEEDKLKSWEAGSEQPTIKQLRKIAKSYQVNFGAFFLPHPPETFSAPVKDYRRHHNEIFTEIDPEIYIDLRNNLNTREVAVELEVELGDEPDRFVLDCSIDDDPKDVAEKIRKAIGLSFSTQKTFRNSRIAFNSWREKLSNLGCLVLQSTKIDLAKMRGYSVYFEQKPLIVVNRKDPYAARTFTLLHELTHLLLQSSGLCDLHTNTKMPAHEQKLEIFCNKVAAQTLVPDVYFLSYPEVRGKDSEEWTDAILAPLARDFGVSREVILRKLLEHGYTTRRFYEEHRERFRQEAEEAKGKRGGGFVTPSVDAVSSKGREFVSLVFDAMNSALITPNDASDYLGVRAKHFPKIEQSLES